MSTSSGVIYILTNPSFPDYVKIGYTNDISQRLRQLNRSECVPFAFRVYATYEVDSSLPDVELHKIIDKLAPGIRAIENCEGQQRVREFYAMEPEMAYSILECMAKIHRTEDKLKKFYVEDDESSEESVVVDAGDGSDAINKLGRVPKRKPFKFSMLRIPIGAMVEFSKDGCPNSGLLVKVVDDNHVEYKDKAWFLTTLAKELMGTQKELQGPAYFKYEGEFLNDIRLRLERQGIIC